MLDSGATDSFISSQRVEDEGIPTFRVPTGKALTISLADGSKYVADKCVKHRIHIGSYSINWTFYVLPLEGFDSILGLDWLAFHNPHVNWERRYIKLRFQGKTHYLESQLKSTKYDWHKDEWVDDPDDQVELMSAKAFLSALRREKHESAFLCIVKKSADDPSLRVDGALEQIEDKRVKELLLKHKHILRDAEFNRYEDIPNSAPEFEIRLHPEDDGRPEAQAPRRATDDQLKILKERLTKYLENNIISPSDSPWGAPVLWVPKKTGGLRMCIDWRRLNQRTVRDNYVLPRIDDLLDRLSTAKFFTAIDLQSMYHQLRIKKEDRPKTAFVTRYGSFEFNVVSFGFTNAPALAQRYMNKLLHPYLDSFVLVYLDDVLIYSDTLEEHYEHLAKVLQILEDNNLCIAISKSFFAKESVEYLGHIVSHKKIQPQVDKIAAIQAWTPPKNPKEIRSFLGLLRFYSRYIDKLADRVEPLQRLTRKDVKWEWSEAQETAFADLKNALTSDTFLVIPDPTKPFVVNVDASKYGLGGVLMQDQGDGLRPCAYYSTHMKGKSENDGEFKYHPTDKEFMAVVRCLQVWKPYLLSSSRKTFVWTDHKPLVHFFSKPAVLDRQVRYLDFLSMFNLEILYIPGKRNLVADALSRKFTLEDAVALTNNDPDSKFVFEGDASIASCAAATIAYTMEGNFLDKIRASYDKDDFARLFLSGSNGRKGSKIPKDFPYENRDGTIWYTRKNGMKVLYIPQVYREACMHECHDTISAGHLGTRKTIERLTRRFHWPRLTKTVQEYVTTCPSCQHNKSLKVAESGVPKPSQIPDERWLGVSMDRIIGLTPSSNGDDAVIIFVDITSKQFIAVSCKGTCTAVQFAYAYINHVYRHHGLATSFTSDRDTLLTSRFWAELTRILGTTKRMSAPSHPQTDGQTEVTIRSIKEMVRHFVNAQHNNWHQMLPLLEFAYNDSVHSSTGYTPFFLNYGRHPYSMMDLVLNASLPKSLARCAPDTRTVIQDLRKALTNAKATLHRTQQKLILQLGEQRSAPVVYKPGDMVSISIKHFKQESKSIPGNPSTMKFAPRYFGPVPVVDRVGTNAYRLDLSKDPLLKHLHPVINVAHLRLIKTSDEYRQSEQPPETVKFEGKEEYVIDKIINDRYNKKRKRYEYLTMWKGFSLTKAKWLPISAFTGSSVKFVQRYLDHIKPHDRPEAQSEEAKRLIAQLSAIGTRHVVPAICPLCTLPVTVSPSVLPSYTSRRHRSSLKPKYRHLCPQCSAYFSTYPILSEVQVS